MQIVLREGDRAPRAGASVDAFLDIHAIFAYWQVGYKGKFSCTGIFPRHENKGLDGAGCDGEGWFCGHTTCVACPLIRLGILLARGLFSRSLHRRFTVSVDRESLRWLGPSADWEVFLENSRELLRLIESPRKEKEQPFPILARADGSLTEV